MPNEFVLAYMYLQALPLLNQYLKGGLNLSEFRDRTLEVYNLAAHNSCSLGPEEVSKLARFVYLFIPGD